MNHRAIAVVVAGALAFAAGCKDDAPPAGPQESPRLPPVEAGRDAGSASGSGSGASLPPVGVGSGSGASLPPVPVVSAAGSGSGSAGSATAGSATAGSAAVAGSATAPGSGTSSGSASAGSATAAGSGSGATPAAPDCDVTIAIAETRIDWSGGASGTIALDGGHVAGKRLTDSVESLDDSACRIVIRPGDAVRFGVVIATMEAVIASRDFRMAILTPAGGRLLATPPSTGAAGTAVRDAKPVAIGKRDIRVGDKVAATVDDADIATKVATALTALQAGTRGIMVIVKAEDGTPYKVVGAVLAGAKTVGFDSVIFAK